MTAELDLDAIQRCADAATAGPWWIDNSTGQYEIWTDAEVQNDMILGDSGVGYQGPKRADAIFMSYARTVIPALIARIRQLEGRQSS